jgi:hypothetical protein
MKNVIFYWTLTEHIEHCDIRAKKFRILTFWNLFLGKGSICRWAQKYISGMFAQSFIWLILVPRWVIEIHLHSDRIDRLKATQAHLSCTYVCILCCENDIIIIVVAKVLLFHNSDWKRIQSRSIRRCQLLPYPYNDGKRLAPVSDVKKLLSEI